MARAYPGSFTGKNTTRTRLSLPGLNVDWFRRFRAAAVAICSLAPLLRGEGRKALRHRADHLRDLLDNFADLVFADDQGRRQRQRIAGDAQHQVVVVERAVQAVETALARLLRAWRQIDARGQPDGADVHHIRLALQRHHRVGEFWFQFIGALEQLFVAVDIEWAATGPPITRLRRHVVGV